MSISRSLTLVAIWSGVAGVPTSRRCWSLTGIWERNLSDSAGKLDGSSWKIKMLEAWIDDIKFLWNNRGGTWDGLGGWYGNVDWMLVAKWWWVEAWDDDELKPGSMMMSWILRMRWWVESWGNDDDELKLGLSRETRVMMDDGGMMTRVTGTGDTPQSQCKLWTGFQFQWESNETDRILNLIF